MELCLSASASALAPSAPMLLAARPPDTHTHTHTHREPHQCKSGGREREPWFSQTLARPHAGAEGAEGAVVPHHWIWRDGMSLTIQAHPLEGGVVPERLRKRPGPLVRDPVGCEGPRHTHTHTHTPAYIHQCKSGGREREPRFS